MGPVASPKFREYVGNIALYAGFTDGELVGDLLVGVSVSDQPFVILQECLSINDGPSGSSKCEFRSALEDK